MGCGDGPAPHPTHKGPSTVGRIRRGSVRFAQINSEMALDPNRACRKSVINKTDFLRRRNRSKGAAELRERLASRCHLR